MRRFIRRDEPWLDIQPETIVNRWLINITFVGYPRSPIAHVYMQMGSPDIDLKTAAIEGLKPLFRWRW